MAGETFLQTLSDLDRAERRLESIAGTITPLVAAGDAHAQAGAGEYVGVHVATLRQLLALAEGTVEP